MVEKSRGQYPKSKFGIFKSECRQIKTMIKKINCWEYIKCGREAEGEKSGELGVCPAATCRTANGLNGGINGGRFCWAVVGTYSFLSRRKDFSLKKALFCSECKFYKKVFSEEGLIKHKPSK